MPNKQTLINTYLGAGEMLTWANSVHGVSKKLVSVTLETDGTTTVICNLVANVNDTFSGVGSSKKEATAAALSTRFPS